MGRSGTAGPKVGRGSKLWQQYKRPPGPFVWFTREMLKSPAWRGMSLPARRVLDVYCENLAHAGNQNGDLIVTSPTFARWGSAAEFAQGNR